MSRIIDYIALGFILFILSFALAMLATNSIVIALIFSLALCFASLFTIKYVSSIFQKPYSWNRLEVYLCMCGSEYAINLMKSTIKNAKIESGLNYIVMKNSVIIANFKFSVLSYADINEACKIAIKHEKTEIYMLAKAIDRKAYQIATMQNIKVQLIKTKQFFKYLSKHNALPNLKKVKRKFDIKMFFEIVFSRRNLKSYLFSGTILIATSFLTPLKVYYISIGSILLVLALLCLTPLGNGSISSPKAFEELEEMINNQ